MLHHKLNDSACVAVHAIVRVCFLAVLSVDIKQSPLLGHFPIDVTVLAAYTVAERGRQFREFEAQIVEPSALALLRNIDALQHRELGKCA
ncbi:MAG: hypothetical protein JNL77_07990 [Nitrosomonas sp.]|nr:hypothetical protein [Nitrosomonas sp.]